MERMAVLKLGYSAFLMPLDKAVKAAEMLADAEMLETDYSVDVGFKLRDESVSVEVKMLSIKNRGELELSRN